MPRFPQPLCVGAEHRCRVALRGMEGRTQRLRLGKSQGLYVCVWFVAMDDASW